MYVWCKHSLLESNFSGACKQKYNTAIFHVVPGIWNKGEFAKYLRCVISLFAARVVLIDEFYRFFNVDDRDMTEFKH